MNAYRVALILCRAVAIALWWSAGLRLLAVAITLIVARLGIAGMQSVPVTQLSLQALFGVVALAVAASFLQIFAVALASSMTGSSSFEGDAVASRLTLDSTEKALASAGGGLFLLFFGASNAIPWLLMTGQSILGLGFGTTGAIVFYSMLSSLIPAVIQCLVGFVLAFSQGLRRVMKVQ